ncbi:MAG: carbohydrate porin [Betaproteobacteria bacterium]|nr:carbohydrate porin [Betaproteobacteria bacterium]
MRRLPLAAALLALGMSFQASAKDDALLQQLLQRLDRLEARNAELEKEVKTLKGEREAMGKGLESERISQYEPEITARLKAVEKDVLDMKKPAKLAEKLDGVAVGASLVTVAQGVSGLPEGAQGGSQLNYRADVTVELPLEQWGGVEHKLFGHVRIGQGLGLNTSLGNLTHFASAPNAVAFRASGASPDDSVAVLGQAWYQAAIPLPFGGFKQYSKEKLELTFGKMDIFGFFDQNDAAADEATQFLNSVFVHNPLLDAGGEVGVDANGFQPGFIASYLNETNKTEPWRVTLGVFGAGDEGSNYQRSLSAPLLMLQAEKHLRLFGGLGGNYRAYAWSRDRAARLDGTGTERHSGWGVSIDQRVDEGITLFARYGHLLKGDLPFRQALAAGAEFNGSSWGRGADALGLGWAWLKASSAYRELGSGGDLDGDGVLDFAFAPAGAERVAELYYRYRLTPQFEISPDLQWIRRGGANPEAKDVKVFGLRASLSY